MSQRLVFVGGGPRTTGILLRLAANAGLGHQPISEIHVIDPYPAGGGRIWRRQQSSLLWMNSMAQDVTIFADDSVTMSGPVVRGPRLDEWVLGEGRETVIKAGLGHELEHFSSHSFPSRQLQSLYLEFAFNHAVRSLIGCGIAVEIHEMRAVEVLDLQDVQSVELSNSHRILADAVVLTQGHLDVAPAAETAALEQVAATEGLIYIPPGFTADQDLSDLPAGHPVLVRGFGLAFIDAMVLLTEGRGGTFRQPADGVLDYLPSGREPQLWVGSRRGVPYLPKLSYQVPVVAGAPQYFDDESLAAFGEKKLDYHRHIFPLLQWNLRHAHYEQLFRAHPERTHASWDEVQEQLHLLLPPELGGQTGASVKVRSFVRGAVPNPADRFNFGALNRPLAGLQFGDRAGLETYLAGHIADRLRRSADPDYSMDLAVFQTLLRIYFRVHELGTQGRFTLFDLRENINRSLHNLFSYIASGPPPIRLEQLLALHRAGIVRFLGPEVRVGLTQEGFTASSPALDHEVVTAHALIDAHLADDSASAVKDELLQRLLNTGQVTVERSVGSGGTLRGKFLTDSAGHPVREDGTVHPGRYLLGPMVSGGESETPFARPGINARGFQRADDLARRLLGLDTHIDTTISVP